MFAGMLLLIALQMQPEQLREDLLLASRYGNAVAGAALLKAGVDPDSRHALTGWTALMAACYYGHTPLVQQLLDAGADPNAVDKRGGTPLMKTVAMPGGDDSQLIHNKTEILQLLLAAGADAHKKDALGGTAWQTSMILEQSEFVDVFAAAGVHGVRESQLMEAIARQDGTAVQRALAQELDINYRDESGMTILGEATLSGNAEIVRAVLSHGADVNARLQKGWTPLMLAAFRNSPEVIRVLLESGADRSLRNETGQAALDLAPPNSDSFRLLSR